MLAFTGSAQAGSIDDLRSEVEALRAENAQIQQQLTQIRAERGEAWLNERRAEEVKALVAEVLADADTRASLLDEGMTAGHNGKNFFLAAANGSFLLTISGQIQIRYIWDMRERSSSTSVDDIDENEAGFQIRRAKMLFSGHIGNPKLKYVIKLAVDRGDNSVSSDEIVISYEMMDGLTIWAGEDKAPFLREQTTSSKRQLAVERSLVNEFFTVDKAQGVGLIWEPSENIRAAAMINDGAHSGDGDGGDHFTNLYFRTNDDQVEFAITARVDVKLAGDWKQMKDFTAWHGEPFALFIGAAIHHQHGEVGDDFSSSGARGNDEVTTWTIDASLEEEAEDDQIALRLQFQLLF